MQTFILILQILLLLPIILYIIVFINSFKEGKHDLFNWKEAIILTIALTTFITITYLI